MTDHTSTQDPSSAQLTPAFDALRAGMALHSAPRGVEKELLAAFARQFPPQRWHRRLSWKHWSMAGGLGAGVAAALLVTLGTSSTLRMQAPGQLAAPAALASVGIDERGDFFALESQERIEQESDAHMVEAHLARSDLAALGVPVSPENAGDSVRAELLIGSDGAALALRLSVP